MGLGPKTRGPEGARGEGEGGPIKFLQKSFQGRKKSLKDLKGLSRLL
jgi:hypothetical protein